MDSSNNHHHHHVQDHVVGSSSSYGVGTTTHAWSTTPTSFMKTTNINGLTSHPSDQPVLLSTQYDPDMAGPNFAYRNLPVHVQDYYRKYADLLNGNEHNLMNKTADQISPGDQWLYSNHGREHCTQIFPSTNVSSLNQMDMNSEARDLLTSSSFSGNLGASSRNYNEVGISRDHGFYTFGAFDDHMRQPHHARLYDIDKISIPISNGSSVETKRSSNKVEPKAPSQNVTKKSRLEARASCPPFKVRKEKLGDRIAALQQLVSPFGKTDTASVLMEAIGYIKFLQDQVETLSVPYMKASHNMSSRVIKEGLDFHQNEKDGEPKRDLKSRGLCLVPVSCVSYITDGGGAVVWPPPHFS